MRLTGEQLRGWYVQHATSLVGGRLLAWADLTPDEQAVWNRVVQDLTDALRVDADPVGDPVGAGVRPGDAGDQDGTDAVVEDVAVDEAAILRRLRGEG